MFLYGTNSVLERLKHNPESIKKICLENNFNSTIILNLIKSNNVPLKCLSKQEMHKLFANEKTQGVIAEIKDFAYGSFDKLVSEKDRTLLFLDRIYDPQNLGAIIRTAACFGKFAVIIPRHKACGITDTVLHVASGGENYIPVSVVSNLSNAIIEAKKNGFWIAGAVVDNGEDISKTKFPFPLGIVLGSEGEGIRYGVDKNLDLRVMIPMAGAKLSLNVTIACAVFCYQISVQQSIR